ncbi:MarR family transcriptional regulator [Candidatus Woesearchaeota archaeon]|nr:MarR family transcriptional regulator [Candidatus Woesearchaeota archaeon]
MDNKKLGATIIILTLVIGGILFYVMSQLKTQQTELGCMPSQNCIQIDQSLSITHVAVGALSFALALGVYLLLFHSSEDAIMKRLEEDKNKKLGEEKFSILLKGLDEFEKKTVNAVRDQPGITQNTLRLRTDLSKAKLSQVLQVLEKKGLIARTPKSKTYEVYLKEQF